MGHTCTRPSCTACEPDGSHGDTCTTWKTLPTHTHHKSPGVKPSTLFCFCYQLQFVFLFHQAGKSPTAGKRSEPRTTAVQHFSENVQSFHQFQRPNELDWTPAKRNKSPPSVLFFSPSDPAATVSCRSSWRSWRPPGDIISRGRKRPITCSGSFIYLFIFARLLIHDERFRGHRAARSLSYSRGHRKSERPAR